MSLSRNTETWHTVVFKLLAHCIYQVYLNIRFIETVSILFVTAKKSPMSEQKNRCRAPGTVAPGPVNHLIHPTEPKV